MIIPKVTLRSTAALKLPRSIEPLITHVQRIVTCVTDNPYFPAPVPAPWVIGKAIADLKTAQTATLTRTKGTIEVRDEKRWALVSLLQQLRGYVQVVADADPDNAGTTITSAGFSVRKQPGRCPRSFSAKPGLVSGVVKVSAPSAGHRASYEWVYSVDGGESWLEMPPTLQASTKIAGLTPGTSVMFRYRAITGRGASGWSQPVTLAVVK